MRHSLLALAPLFTACIFTQADPPLLQVTSPERSMILDEMGGMVTVNGLAVPNASGAAIESLAVNGTPVRVSSDGTFTVTIAVPPGGSLIQTVATDADGGVATDTRAIVAGERRASGSSIPRAIAVALSPNIFTRIADFATQELKQVDLDAVIKEANPLVNANTPGGCFYGQAFVDSLSISDAAVSLVPTSGGLKIEATFDKPVIAGRMKYAVACSDGTSNFTARANKATVRGTLVFENTAQGLVPRLDEPAFETPGLQVTTGGIPGVVLGILPLESVLSAATPAATRAFVDPMIRDALADLAKPHQLEVLGKSVTVAAVPTVVQFTPTSGLAMLDLRFAMAGGEGSRGFTFTPNGLPDIAPRDGIGLGVADDLVNDAIGQLAASGALDLTIPFDGGDFDTVVLKPTLPPMINADGKDGRLKLLLPDVDAKFLRGTRTVASASINAQIAVAVRPAGDGGSVAIDLGEAAISSDASGDDTGLAMSPSSSFAAAIDLGATDQKSSIQLTIGAIPLPKLGDIELSEVSLTADSGYVKAKATIK